MTEEIDYKRLLYVAYFNFRHRNHEDCPTHYDGCNCFMNFDDFDNAYWSKIYHELANKVIVNGEEFSVDVKEITYDMVCELAVIDPKTLPSMVCFSRSNNSIIAPGQSIPVVGCMWFTVIHTNCA
jgi:hypothetical protein